MAAPAALPLLRLRLLPLLPLLLQLLLPPRPAAADGPANVLLFMPDDLPFVWPEAPPDPAAGRAWESALTPHLNRVRDEGAVFTRAYVAGPKVRPTPNTTTTAAASSSGSGGGSGSSGSSSSSSSSAQQPHYAPLCPAVCTVAVLDAHRPVPVALARGHFPVRSS